MPAQSASAPSRAPTPALGKRHAMHQALIGAALLAAILPAAQAQVVNIRWSVEGRFVHQGTVAAGKFVELCGKLPAGRQVRWSFDAAAPLDFNLHYHQGKAVVTPARLVQATQGRQTLLTKTEQDYCWMWTNKTPSDVGLAVLLVR